MQTAIEALYKSKNKIQFGWNPEPLNPPTLTQIQSYKVYVGLAPVTGSLQKLAENISPQESALPGTRGKVTYTAQIADVRALLSMPAADDFTNRVLYWAITYVDQNGSESATANSEIVTVFPVGIEPKLRKDDPTTYRQIFGFSDEELRWVKAAASSKGAIIVDTSDYFKANITTEYTYTGGGDVSTAKSYLTDRTAPGSPATLTVNEYSGGNLVKQIIMDSTV